MYNIALGMYDYQLVMYVAQKSQKDPKEYVPFLQELSKLDQSYAKFKIDCHLKRFSKAVGHIAILCEDDDKKFHECIEVVKKHTLFDAALEAFKDNEKCYKKICNLFADHLRIKGKLVEASLMYERGGDYLQALSSARNTLDWQRCLILAKKCSFDDTQLKDLAGKLMASLSDLNRFKECSEIVRKFYSDENKLLIETLINGRFYSDAILEISFNGDENLLEELIKPRLNQHLIDGLNSISEEKNKFLQQKERLAQVRDEKAKKSLLDDEQDDMLSDTTSIASQSSRLTSKTFRSSKAKRKYERKLTNLKEGNKFEDIALIDSLWKFVQKINSGEYQNSIRELIKNGVEMGLDEKAKELQVRFF
jgi:elongator complex protein 1